MATCWVFQTIRIKRAVTRRKQTSRGRELRDRPSDACSSPISSDLKHRANDVEEGCLDWSHFTKEVRRDRKSKKKI